MKSARLFVWTILLIVVSFIFTTAISINSINTVLESNDQELSKVLTSKIYDSINNRLTEPIIVAETMANDYFLTGPLSDDDFPNVEFEDRLVSYLQRICTSMNYNSAFVVSEKSRTYYTANGFNKIVSPETDEHDIWYSTFVDGGQKYDFDVDTDEVNNDAWTVFVNARIEDENGELLGVCGVSVVMTDLQDILTEYEKEYGVKINLINKDGLVQVDTDLINIENSVLSIQIADTVNNSDYIYQETEDGGYAVSKYVESLGWYLVVQNAGSDDIKVYSELVYKVFIIFIIILLILIITVSSCISIHNKKMRQHSLEIEQYAKEQEVLKAEAETASKAKGFFLANMSHEIRTPINAVLGMDEMILQESNEDVILEYASDIKRAGNTLLSLINDILDFSKIESGKMDIIPVEYDLSTVINDLVSMLSVKVRKKNLTLNVNVDENTPNHLRGDEVRIRQIITNILTNAVKYTNAGTITLTVSGKILGESFAQIYVSVKDTGIGIRPEDKKRLFDSFQRVDESRNRNIEGTGLGLSITMQLLRLMGSCLDVSSVYGEGSDFYFTLKQELVDTQPIGDLISSEAADRQTYRHSEHIVAPGAKILVVDDNEMNLKVFTGLLKNSKMNIDTAPGGESALEMMRKKSYHIIFMDHLMPKMDGIETLQRSKTMNDNQSKGAIMIALTANAVSGVKEMFLQNGFDDYLSKPILLPKLEDMISRHLPNDIPQYCELTDKTMTTLKAAETNVNSATVDWECGLQYCMNDEELYAQMLRIFVDERSGKELESLYMQENWEEYRIKVHAAKTNLANIGATTVSEKAQKLELALKENNDVSFIKKNHGTFMEQYNTVVMQVREHLRSNQ